MGPRRGGGGRSMAVPNAYLGEIVGTAILILLGDGVVAAVLLNKSKAQNSGWIVITFGWGMAVMVGVYAVGHFTGAPPQPGGHARLLGRRRHRRLATSRSTSDRRVPRRVHRRRRSSGSPTGDHLARDGGPGPEAGGVLDRPGDPQLPPLNLVTEIIGTFVLVFGDPGSCAGSSQQGDGGSCIAACSRRRPARRPAGVRRSACRSAGRPATRSTRPATWARASSHAILPIPGKGASDWALLLGPGRRAAHRRRSVRCGALFDRHLVVSAEL